MSARNTNKIKTAVKVLAILSIVAVIFFLFRYFEINLLLKNLLIWIKSLGMTGALVFIGVYIISTVMFLPGSVLTLGSGFLFGVIFGSVVVMVGATLGASAAFLVGRYLARGSIQKKIEGNKKFKAIDEAIANEGWKIVFLCRLSPIFPFNLLNYSFGLTKIPFKHYFLSSWVGMIPGTIMYVYIGSLASSLATLGAGGRARTPWEWSLYIVGFIATVAVSIFVTKIARQALNKSIEQKI